MSFISLRQLPMQCVFSMQMIILSVNQRQVTEPGYTEWWRNPTKYKTNLIVDLRYWYPDEPPVPTLLPIIRCTIITWLALKKRWVVLQERNGFNGSKTFRVSHMFSGSEVITVAVLTKVFALRYVSLDLCLFKK